MKVRLYPVVAAVAVLMASNVVSASTLSITVNGEVTESTCALKADGNFADTITLIKVPKGALSAADAFAGYKEETYTFENCPRDGASTLVKVNLDNQPSDLDTANKKILKNTYVGVGAADVAAQNVGIEIFFNGKSADLSQPIEIDTGTTEGDFDLTVGAQYLATAAAEPGKVQARLNLTVGYE